MKLALNSSESIIENLTNEVSHLRARTGKILEALMKSRNKDLKYRLTIELSDLERRKKEILQIADNLLKLSKYKNSLSISLLLEICKRPI